MEPTQAFIEALENARKYLPQMDYRLDTLVNLRMIRMLNNYNNAFFNSILAEHRLNESMFYALVMLYRCEGGVMQPSELSNILELTRTSATRLSDDLVGNGWVMRRASHKDRRSVLLSISPSGMKLVETVLPQLVQMRLKLWQDFSDEEISQLQFLMTKLLSRVKKEVKEMHLDE